jgi:hypothetical protein
MRPFSLPRVCALSTLAVLCLAAGCPASAPSADPPPVSTRAGGARGDGSASGGSNAPSAATGGPPGAGGDIGATGGAVGTGGGAGVDAAAIDVPAAGGSTGAAMDADGSAGADGGPNDPIDPNDPKTWPGGAFAKPFIVLCPDGAPKAACCMHYCSCMMTNCSKQIPADCLNACMGNQKWDMRCRVYNCFESLNPLAQKDHQAHCEHAGVVTGTQRTRGAGDTHEKCHNPGDPDEK